MENIQALIGNPCARCYASNVQYTLNKMLHRADGTQRMVHQPTHNYKWYANVYVAYLKQQKKKKKKK